MQEVMIRDTVDLPGIEVWFSRDLFPDPVNAKISKLASVVCTLRHPIALNRCIIVYLDPRYDKEEALAVIKTIAMGRKE